MIRKTFIAVFAIIFVLLDVCICVFTANTWMELKDNSVYARSDMDTHVYIYKSCYDSVPDNARPYIYPKNVKGILDKRDALPTKDEAIRVAEIIFFSILKDDFYQYKFTSVSLVADSYWIVMAKQGGAHSGGGIYLEIRKKDAKVLRVIKGK